MNNRLQKKCFFAATGFHVSLLVILLFGSAFFSREDQSRDLQLVDMISPNVVDAAIVSGGSPDVTPPPPGPTPAQPTTPPAVQNPPPPPVKQPEPPKVVKPKDEDSDVPPKKEVKPTPESFSSQKKVREVVLDAKDLKKKTSDKGKQTPKTTGPTSRDSSAETRELANAFSAAAGSLRSSLSPGTKVGLVGPGGLAFTGYENIIQSKYQAQFNMELPNAGEVGESAAEVDVSVTIGRDGKVRASKITSPSRNTALNKLVQRVMDKVTFIHPFPQTSSDLERTFTITFDLKPKKGLG